MRMQGLCGCSHREPHSSRWARAPPDIVFRLPGSCRLREKHLIFAPENVEKHLTIFLNLFKYEDRQSRTAAEYLLHRASRPKTHDSRYGFTKLFIPNNRTLSRAQRCKNAFELIKSVSVRREGDNTDLIKSNTTTRYHHITQAPAP